MGLLRKTVVVLIGIVVVGGGAIYTGIIPITDLSQPDASVEDIGDWGDVSDNRIVIIHEIAIYNPNPIELDIGDAVTVSIDLKMNGIRLGSVEKTGLDIAQGDNSVPVKSELNQNRISEFWANFVNQDETIHADVSVDLRVNRGPGFSVSTPTVEASALTSERPVSDAINGAASQLEGSYEKQVPSGGLRDELRDRIPIGPSEPASVGYTVEDVKMSWGEVNNDKTNILIDLKITNSGDVPVPAVPDGIAVNILMNDIQVFEANSEPISLRNVDRDSVIRPDETKSYTLVATADNENIEQWFTSYAKQREQSSVRTELQFIFNLGEQTITLPRDGAVAYECSFRSGIFVDNQSQSTTCGDDGTVKIGPTQFDQSEVESTVENTDERLSDEENQAPTAVINVDPQSGEAPLAVTLDGSSSSDPDGEIVSYRWTIDGPTPGGVSETLNRQFQTAGDYEVELTVRDDDGDTDTTSKTISVSSRLPSSDSDDDSPGSIIGDDEEGSAEDSDESSSGDSGSGSNEKPSADIEPSRTSGTAPVSVEFDASGSSDPDGSIEEYEWDIEGQEDADGQTVSREFTEPGSYEVELTVTDDDGEQASTSVTIEVNAPPTASASADPPSGDAPLNVDFDGSDSSDPDGEIVEYRWEIEGPTPGGTGETITRRFQTRGTYDVTLTVTDDDGATDSTTITVEVEGRFGKIYLN